MLGLRNFFRCLFGMFKKNTRPISRSRTGFDLHILKIEHILDQSEKNSKKVSDNISGLEHSFDLLNKDVNAISSRLSVFEKRLDQIKLASSSNYYDKKPSGNIHNHHRKLQKIKNNVNS